MNKLLVLFILFILTVQSKAQFKIYSGLAYSTESFNIENIENTNNSSYNHIQYDPYNYFSTINLYTVISKPINKTFSVNLDNYLRYNHHYYKRLQRNNGLEPHNQVPQVKKIKLDLIIGFTKNIEINKKKSFLFGMGLGYNNINSGYNYKYNDTFPNGSSYNLSFKGNWLHFTPNLNIGLNVNDYRIKLDAILTKDPTFSGLLSTSIYLSISKFILKF